MRSVEGAVISTGSGPEVPLEECRRFACPRMIHTRAPGICLSQRARPYREVRLPEQTFHRSEAGPDPVQARYLLNREGTRVPPRHRQLSPPPHEGQFHVEETLHPPGVRMSRYRWRWQARAYRQKGCQRGPEHRVRYRRKGRAGSGPSHGGIPRLRCALPLSSPEETIWILQVLHAGPAGSSDVPSAFSWPPADLCQRRGLRRS